MLAIAAGGGLLGALLAPRLRRALTARSALLGESWLMVLALPWLLLVHNALLIGLVIGWSIVNVIPAVFIWPSGPIWPGGVVSTVAASSDSGSVRAASLIGGGAK